MKLVELLKQIESVQFDTYLNSLSGFKIFLISLQNSELIKHLIQETRFSSAKQEIVLKRLMALLEQEANPSYTHPQDTAIAAYLYVLDGSNATELVRAVAEGVKNVPNLWWSRMVATNIIQKLSTTISFGSLPKTDLHSQAATEYSVLVLPKTLNRQNWKTNTFTDSANLPIKEKIG